MGVKTAALPSNAYYIVVATANGNPSNAGLNPGDCGIYNYSGCSIIYQYKIDNTGRLTRTLVIMLKSNGGSAYINIAVYGEGATIGMFPLSP
jgi:hypothetical protein